MLTRTPCHFPHRVTFGRRARCPLTHIAHEDLTMFQNHTSGLIGGFLAVSLTLSALSSSDEIVLLIFGDAKRDVYEAARTSTNGTPVSGSGNEASPANEPSGSTATKRDPPIAISSNCSV